MGKVVTYLLDHPLVTNLVSSVIVVAGIAAGLSLNREGYPNVDLDKMTIVTVYPGASPEDVELNVTVKIEDAIKNISGIQKFNSKSVEGSSFIKVYLDSEAKNKDTIKSNIRWAVNSVSDLPDEILDQPLVKEITTAEAAVYEVALSLDSGNYSQLHDQSHKLQDRIKTLKQVARVRLRGARDREYQVVIDRTKLSKYYVSFEEIVKTIQENKVRVSGGSVESFVNEVGIIAVSEFEDPKEIEDMIIRSSTSGNVVRIGDVGKVEETFAKEETILRYNGIPGMGLFVEKNANSDIIDTVAAVREVIAEYQKTAPSGLQIFPLYDLSIDTETRLSIVSSNMLAGFILVLLILFIFLDWRVALWSAVGIPISVCAALIVMAYLEISIDSISLCGMVVVLGMIVDDAIIIAESIYRNLEKGLPPREAAVKGLSVVIRPVFGTIISTIIAFSPIYFVPGMIGQFSGAIPTIVIIMLAGSFIEAVTLLPAHIGHVRGGSGNFKISRPPGQKILDIWQASYRKFLSFAMRYRGWIFSGFLGIAAVTVWVGVKNFRFVMFPDSQAYQLVLTGKVPEGYPVKFTAEQVKHLEKAIQELPEGVVQGFRATIGLDLASDEERIFPIPSQSSFFMYISLTAFSQRDMTAKEVKEAIEAKLKSVSHKINKLNIWIMSGGPPLGKPIEVRVTGDNEEQLATATAEVLKILEPMQVYDLDTGVSEGKKQYRYLPDHQRLAAANATWSAVTATIKSAFDGTIVTHQETPSERIPIRVIGDPVQIEFDRPLSGLKVRNATGQMLNISPLVKRQEITTVNMINRHNAQRSVTIQGDVDKKKTTPNKVYGSLLQPLRDLSNKFPDLRIETGGEAKESAEMVRRLMWLLIAALCMIFVLLVVQFNSFSQPFMVILAVPFGLIGVQLSFTLQNIDLSLLAMVGIVGFAGVVINDSLIMVDYINRLRGELRHNSNASNAEQKETFHKAIIDGAVTRFRPVVLTTITTISGLIPTAYGLIGGVDSFISPLVMAMTWGLIVGTPAVLILVPVLYAINEDVALAFKRTRE